MSAAHPSAALVAKAATLDPLAAAGALAAFNATIRAIILAIIRR
jgi:hypothetical protein